MHKLIMVLPVLALFLAACGVPFCDELVVDDSAGYMEELSFRQGWGRILDCVNVITATPNVPATQPPIAPPSTEEPNAPPIDPFLEYIQSNGYTLNEDGFWIKPFGKDTEVVLAQSEDYYLFSMFAYIDDLASAQVVTAAQEEMAKALTEILGPAVGSAVGDAWERITQRSEPFEVYTEVVASHPIEVVIMAGEAYLVNNLKVER